MVKLRSGLYVDGLNFYYGALRGSSNKWLDLERFGQLLLPRDELVVIRYFTALVNARVDDPRTPVRQQTYLKALGTRESIVIHKGRFTSRVKSRALADSVYSPHTLFNPNFRPKSLFELLWRDMVRRRRDGVTRARVIIEEEKGSDVNLGVHLVSDAARGFIDKAVVISNDSDLAEALKMARIFGVKVGVLNPHAGVTSRHLRVEADFEIPFRSRSLSRCQFPPTVLDGSGREIHKPKEWR